MANIRNEGPSSRDPEDEQAKKVLAALELAHQTLSPEERQLVEDHMGDALIEEVYGDIVPRSAREILNQKVAIGKEARFFEENLKKGKRIGSG